jgi:hypothetical protein
MSLALPDVLERHLREAKAIWLNRGQPCPEWVFATAEGTLFDRNNVAKAFRRGLKAAGLPHHSPHDCGIPSPRCSSRTVSRSPMCSGCWGMQTRG